MTNQSIDVAKLQQILRSRSARSVRLALLVLAALPAVALAQSPQVGTPSQRPPISGPSEVGPPGAVPEMSEEEEEDEDEMGEGCPYIPNTLELMV